MPQPASNIRPRDGAGTASGIADRYTPTALVRITGGYSLTTRDLALCRSFIKQHSKSFYFSSLLLPRAHRHEAWALYAFCRQADDTVDGENLGDGRVAGGSAGRSGDDSAVLLRRVAGLRQRLRGVYSGQVGDGDAQVIDRAFSAVVLRTGLPSAVPERLLAGMEMDARGTQYPTWESLLGYCMNVASTVGLMMTYVLGHRMPDDRRAEVMMRACDLGIAMQLTNIARDVGEDARRGRVYLPDELLYRHGLHPDAVLQLAHQDRPAPLPLRRAVAELLSRAAAHYQAARAGIPMLPRAAWLGIASAERIYRAIGEKLLAAGCDPLAGRVHVGAAGKLWRLLGALCIGLLPSRRRPPRRLTHGPADDLLLRFCREADVID